MSDEAATIEYRCPGETYSISRAVHLGRLADFYPACRDCPRHDDTAGLSSRTVRRLREVFRTAKDIPRCDDETIQAVPLNEMTPRKARAIAVEFARLLQSSRQPPTAGYLPIVFGSDGRLATAAMVAAMIEGIRWTGCEAVDLGPVSAPCLASALAPLSAAGGIYLGNPSGAAHTVGVKFWIGSEPQSRLSLRESGATFAEPGRPRSGSATFPGDRPVRAFGPLRRFDAAEPYLNELRPAYHALRPLRFVLRTSCELVFAYLEELTRNVACRAIVAEAGPLGEQVVAARAHFGIDVSDDGEMARVFDERGTLIANERLAEFWHAAEYEPVADALRTLTVLLVLLSRDDLPFSAVLEHSPMTA